MSSETIHFKARLKGSDSTQIAEFPKGRVFYEDCIGLYKVSAGNQGNTLAWSIGYVVNECVALYVLLQKGDSP
jgi:hypothetical protein